MKVKYDKNADALYIEIQKGVFAKNKKMDSSTLVDLDKEGNILGIEFLDVSKKIPLSSLSKLSTVSSTI